MDLDNFALFGMLRKRMDWLAERQTVLAQNMANADTPHYAAKDLVAPDFKRLLETLGVGSDGVGKGRTLVARSTGAPTGPLQLAATNAAHIQPQTAQARPVAQTARGEDEHVPNGNDVNVEEQISKVTETQMDYQMSANLYRKHLAMLKSVLRR
jgi:flagellar basal-body rod protein FlgB